MINSNPETVSTDYDTSDLLFFRAIDARRHVLNVCERLNGGRFATPSDSDLSRRPMDQVARWHSVEEEVKGVIVQFGGQTRR